MEIKIKENEGDRYLDVHVLSECVNKMCKRKYPTTFKMDSQSMPLKTQEEKADMIFKSRSHGLCYGCHDMLCHRCRNK